MTMARAERLEIIAVSIIMYMPTCWSVVAKKFENAKRPCANVCQYWFYNTSRRSTHNEKKPLAVASNIVSACIYTLLPERPQPRRTLEVHIMSDTHLTLLGKVKTRKFHVLSS